MSEFKRKTVFRIILCILCAAIVISVPLFATTRSSDAAAETEMQVITVWQIDSFEGGRGSRASYLQAAANEFSKKQNIYFNVTQLTADAMRMNLNDGNVPDIISYGAGTVGLERFIKNKTPFVTWAHGGYCILTVTDGADFSDVNAENTVINEGTGNMSKAAALFSGLEDAQTAKPTGAYVDLINGKYKYLLGTQRDIFRLKTREVAFTLKSVTEFNDLYQNISIVTENVQKSRIAQKFIDFLLSKSNELSKLGLMYDGISLYDDEMRELEAIEYENKIVAPLSEETKKEIEAAISNSDLKKLKNFCI